MYRLRLVNKQFINAGRPIRAHAFAFRPLRPRPFLPVQRRGRRLDPRDLFKSSITSYTIGHVNVRSINAIVRNTKSGL